jgi:pimeloyl-ACP methyl ester carboxylesterase
MTESIDSSSQNDNPPIRTKGAVQSFMEDDDSKRVLKLLNGVDAAALKAHYGEPAYDELRGLAEGVRRAGSKHLGPQTPKNLIFVPGVMGSSLEPVALGGLWWIDVLRNRDKIDKLGLDPFGADKDPGNMVRASNVDQTYDGFLYAAYLRDDFGCVKFPYDWRKSLLQSVDALRDLIIEVHRQHPKKSPVHLVAHSMGGLLVRATLARYGAELWPKLGRIVFLGTPHYGATAIACYVKNHFYGTDLKLMLALVLSRDTFRSLYGPIGLLPAPRGLYPGTRTSDQHQWTSGDPTDPYVHPCVNFDLYAVDQWHLGLDAVASVRFQRVLDAAKSFYEELFQSHASLTNEQRRRMLVIAGVGQTTPFRLANTPHFFGLWEKMDKVTSRMPGDPHRDGDGSVPVASARLENVEARYIRGEHSALPNIPKVFGDVFRWLNSEPLTLPATIQEALRSHLGPADERSTIPHVDGSADVLGPAGRWDHTLRLDTPEENVIRKLEEGKVPAFHRVRIL